MTEGQPEPHTSHSEAAAKLAALLREFAPVVDPASETSHHPSPEPESESSADLAPESTPESTPELPPLAAAVAARPAPVRPAPAAAVEPVVAAPPQRRRTSRLGAVAFTLVVVLLIASIPVLGIIGKNVLLKSKDGKYVSTVQNPRAPGYEAIVDQTPTALMAQVGADGTLNGITVLALGAGDAGGSVIFVPISTKVAFPANGVDRLSTAYALGGLENLRNQVGSLLDAAVTEAVIVNNSKWAELVMPVGSLTINNPDAVTMGGHRIPSGPLTLQPADVGPYLAAVHEGEVDTNRLERQRLVWQAWVKAVAAKVAADKNANAVPGEINTGIGRFVRTFAKGTLVAETLAVDAGKGGAAPAFVANTLQVREQVLKAIPLPKSPTAGARTTVRLLNGVAGEPLAGTFTDALVRGGAEIDALGNAKTLGQRETLIEYYSASNLMRAIAMQNALGGGKVTLQLRDDQSVDVTVTIGSDLAAGPSTTLTPTSSGG